LIGERVVAAREAAARQEAAPIAPKAAAMRAEMKAKEAAAEAKFEADMADMEARFEADLKAK
jgi:hypothetical protein